MKICEDAVITPCRAKCSRLLEQSERSAPDQAGVVSVPALSNCTRASPTRIGPQLQQGH